MWRLVMPASLLEDEPQGRPGGAVPRLLLGLLPGDAHTLLPRLEHPVVAAELDRSGRQADPVPQQEIEVGRSCGQSALGRLDLGGLDLGGLDLGRLDLGRPAATPYTGRELAVFREVEQPLAAGV